MSWNREQAEYLLGLIFPNGQARSLMFCGVFLDLLEGLGLVASSSESESSFWTCFLFLPFPAGPKDATMLREDDETVIP